MQFNIETFLETIDLVYFRAAANEIQDNAELRALSPEQFMQSARNQFQIIDRVNETGTVEMVRGVTADGNQQVEVNTQNVSMVLEQALTVYMYALVVDYDHDGNLYTFETPVIEEEVMARYADILNNVEDPDDITDAYIDALDDMLDTEEAKLEPQIHNTGGLKPTMKLSNSKDYNTKGWWN